MRHVSATEARVHLGELLTAVQEHGEIIAIEQRGKIAALLSPAPPATATSESATPDAAWQAWWSLSATQPSVESHHTLLEESYDR